MPVSSARLRIAAQSGISLRLSRGDILRIVDPGGEQVADVALFSARDVRDGFSPGRTMDYNASVRLGLGHVLYSQRSAPLARVVEDRIGVHDFLLAPCSAAMFARRGESPHPSCHENLAAALASYGIADDDVTATINVFMNVRIAPDGAVKILPPRSRPGDAFALEALDDLVVGLAACSSELTNNGRCKPIEYDVAVLAGGTSVPPCPERDSNPHGVATTGT